MNDSLASLAYRKSLTSIGGVLLLVFALDINSAAAQSTSGNPANAEKVVQFALDNLGKVIPKGECTDLVNKALESAKAKQLQKRPRSNAEEDLNAKSTPRKSYPEEIYVWGIPEKAPPLVRKSTPGFIKPLGRFVQYHRGQIIQFENCYFEKKGANNKVVENWVMPHHTAIIEDAKGTQLTLLHQNSPIGKGVTRLTLDLAWLVPAPEGRIGQIDTYAPESVRNIIGPPRKLKDARAIELPTKAASP